MIRGWDRFLEVCPFNENTPENIYSDFRSIIKPWKWEILSLTENNF